jgi:two-component system chemotaxis response regulator CheB
MGASSGGIEALSAIAAALPKHFEAAICAVVHMSPDSPGILDQIIRRVSRLPVRAVASREPLRPGCFYVPTPDRHMIVEPSLVCATRGPKENRFRPAVDPLFRSAAQTYGPRVIGVILTGDLDDGTAGLWAVKQLGGTAIVQDPADALVPSMQQSACKHVRIDHDVALADLPALLARLVAEDLSEAGGYTVPEPIDIEVNIARHDSPLQRESRSSASRRSTPVSSAMACCCNCGRANGCVSAAIPATPTR